MSATSAPFGLRPVYNPSGVVRQSAGTIASGYGVSIYQNSPVRIAPATAGGETAGTLAAAAAAARFIGVFCGVEWTDSDGRRRVSNKWTANTTGTDIVAYYTRDPSIVYEIQADGSVASTNVGNQYNYSAPGGNDTTGLSTQSLATATGTSTGNAQLRVLGASSLPGNAFGDAYTIVHVQIAQHQNVADIAAY